MMTQCIPAVRNDLHKIYVVSFQQNKGKIKQSKKVEAIWYSTNSFSTGNNIQISADAALTFRQSKKFRAGN